jgi:hypothetical protein
MAALLSVPKSVNRIARSCATLGVRSGVLLLIAVLFSAFCLAQSVVSSQRTAAVSGENLATSDALPEVAAAVPSTPAAAEPPGITFGVDERFRGEGSNNADFNGALNDRLRQVRFRTKALVDIRFNDNVELFTRLAQEGIKRTTDPGQAFHGQASPFYAGETWFDAAYLKLNRLPGAPNLSLQVGRFEIIKGDGWLFADPSSLDGGRSNYSNAFSLKYSRQKSTFELLGILNPKYDEFFPVIAPLAAFNRSNPAASGAVSGANPALTQSGKQLQEWDEAALGVYYTNRRRANTDIDSYVFFQRASNDIRSPGNYLYLPDRHFTVLGGRMVRRLQRVRNLSLVGEFSYELGTESSMRPEVPNFDIRAWGGYGYVSKRSERKTRPFVMAGFWAMSGQDPHSRTVGNFDPLFARWGHSPALGEEPDWSDFYVNSLGPESGNRFWTNLKLAQLESGFTPLKPITITVAYARLGAFDPFAVNPFHAAGSVSPATPTGIFGTGATRGQWVKARVQFTLARNFQGFVNVEKFFPGSFYAVRDDGYWYRVQLVYTYRYFLPFQKRH